MESKIVSFVLLLALIAPLDAFFTYNFHQPVNLQHKLKPVARSFYRHESPIAAPEVKRLPFGYLENPENNRKNDYFWNNA